MLFDFGKANRKVSHCREAGSAFSHSLGRLLPYSVRFRDSVGADTNMNR